MKRLFKPVLDFLESVWSAKEVKKKYSDIILINEEGKVLLLLRSNSDSFCPGQWSLPGGSVEPGEHPSVAALRELKEETGIELDIDDIQFYKEVDRGDNVSSYFIGSASVDDVDIILDSAEHQGYEWVSPSELWKKDCLMDLAKFLAESFDVSAEKFSDELENYSTEKRISDAVVILNKSFDSGELDEDTYLVKIKLLNIIKAEHDKSIIIGKNDDPAYSVRLKSKFKKADDSNELSSDDFEAEYDSYLDNAILYNDKLYDENGIGIPMEPSKVKQLAQQNKTIYQVDCQKLDSFTSASKIFEDVKRFQFEKILPTIKKYNDYYGKYENELINSYSSSMNDFSSRRTELKKSVKELIGEGVSDSESILKVLEFIKSNLNEEIDPLLNIRYQYDSDSIRKRQIFLSELEDYLNDNKALHLFSIEIAGLDSYDDGEFKMEYFDADSIDNITTIHDKVKAKLLQVVNLQNDAGEKLDKGEITDDEFLDILLKADASHGGKLVKKQIVDKTGRKQTKWVSKDNGEDADDSGKQEFTDDELTDYAKNTSLDNLERVIKESPDPKLRQAAHAEIDRRKKEEHISDDKDKKNNISNNLVDELDIDTDNAVYRNTSQDFLFNLLSDGKIKSKGKKFISISLEPDSGGQDNYGDTRIIFDYDKIRDQNSIEIDYEDPDFFDYFPEITKHVTGYSSREEYDNEDDLPWESFLETFMDEQEVVIPSIKNVDGLIQGVEFSNMPSDELIKLLEKNNIKFTVSNTNNEVDDNSTKIKKSLDNINIIDDDIIKGGKAEILKGCLMFYPEINRDKWKNAIEELIPAEIVQEYEYDPHITILYGFDDQFINIERLKSIVNSFVERNPIKIKLDSVSIFSNENDVIKLGIIDVNGNLTKLNEHIRLNFKYESDFPDYKPHMTLAYVNKGEGSKFIGKNIDLDDFGFITLSTGRYIYSNANKQKTEIRPLINEYLSFNKADDNDIEKGKKPYPVGYINHDGFEKQADGKWKYVGKKKLISLGFELQENGKWKKNENNNSHSNAKGIKLTPSNSGVSSGTINYKDDVVQIKIGDNKWIRLNDFIASWDGKIPDEIKQQLKLHPSFGSKVSPQLYNTVTDFISQNNVVDNNKTTNKEKQNNDSKHVNKVGQQLIDEYESLNDEVAQMEFFAKNFDKFDAESFEYFCDNAKLFASSLKAFLSNESSKYNYNIGGDIYSFALSLHSAFNKSFSPKKMEFADYSKCKVSQMRFINAYTNSAYKFVNRFKAGSYGNTELSDSLKKYVTLFAEIVDRGLNNIVNNEEHEYVYRTFNPRTEGAEKVQKRMINYMMNVGNEVGYGTIISTSISPHSAFGAEQHHIIYRVANPKSAKLIQDISDHPGEQEAIFPTTARFEIVGVESVKDEKSSFGIHGKNFVNLKEID